MASTLETAPGPTGETVIVLRRGPVRLDDIWRQPGANEPFAALAAAAAGNGVISLPGDPDGKVRRVPLLTGVGATLRPGLAVETVRVAQEASTLILETDPQRLVIGKHSIALPRDGFLKLVPVRPGREPARTISAVDILEDVARRASLAGAIALIGGSAPELGGLRETPGDPLKPSVQLQADTIVQLASQRAPLSVMREIQFILTFALSAIMLVVAVTASPLPGVLVAIAAMAAVWAGAIGLSLSLDRLIDPLTPTIGAAATFVTASLGSFIMVSRREARIRDRFAQHLAPEVVKRIAENPDMLKIRAEKRELTALFTDIEGFTSMTHRAGPEQLVAELDGYIEGVATIVMDHGGMVDKIVGDAVHALFNAPVDLSNHAARAVECAAVIRSWTEQYRSRPSARLIGLGRTRIGIETGEMVVGDIGIRSKLDYTAHGDAINSAARLEAMNKELGVFNLRRADGGRILQSIDVAAAWDRLVARVGSAYRRLRAVAASGLTGMASALSRRRGCDPVRSESGCRDVRKPRSRGVFRSGPVVHGQAAARCRHQGVTRSEIDLLGNDIACDGDRVFGGLASFSLHSRNRAIEPF